MKGGDLFIEDEKHKIFNGSEKKHIGIMKLLREQSIQSSII